MDTSSSFIPFIHSFIHSDTFVLIGTYLSLFKCLVGLTTQRICSELTMTIQCLCVGLVIVHYAQTGNLTPSIFLLIKYSWPFCVCVCVCVCVYVLLLFCTRSFRLYAELHNKVLAGPYTTAYTSLAASPSPPGRSQGCAAKRPARRRGANC